RGRSGGLIMAARVQAVNCAQAGGIAGRRGKKVIKLRRRRSRSSGAGKGLTVGLAVTLLVVIGAALAANGVRSTWDQPSNPSTAPAGSGIAFQVVEVKPGDTLWSLARRYGSPGQDMAERVAVLQVVNGLEGSFLRAGMELKVPVAADGTL